MSNRRRFQLAECRRLRRAADRVLVAAIVAVPAVVAWSVVRGEPVVSVAWLPFVLIAVQALVRKLAGDALDRAERLRRRRTLGLPAHEDV